MEEDLLALAGEFEQLQSEIIGIVGLASEAWKLDRLGELLGAYEDAHRRLRLLVRNQSHVALASPDHAGARRLLQGALLRELPLDRLVAGTGGSRRTEYSEADIQTVVDEYHTWFSAYDYAENRLDAAVLVLRAGALPPDAARFVDEIVECYSTTRYTAVCALCRVALEALLRPVYRSNRLDARDSPNALYVRQQIDNSRATDKRKGHLTQDRSLFYSGSLDDFGPSIDQMITRLCWLPAYCDATVEDERLRDVLHRVRKAGNDLVHARWTANHSDATSMTRDLFYGLHALYEVNPPHLTL